MVTKTVVHFEIPANDISTLSKFYAEVFGWKIEKAQMPGIEYWNISTGPRGKSVRGGMYKKMGPGDGPRNYIGVDDLDEHIVAFKKAGGKEIMGKNEVPKIGWTYIGLDPEGNKIAMFEPARAPRRKTKKSRQSR